jgi:dephospho-CoA kinase
MRILGLTGGVGMGKSTASAILRRMGLPVFDADAAVHALMSPGGAAVAAVAKAFPGVKKGQAIDRAALGRLVFGNGPKMRRLETILHPMVRAQEHDFLRAARARRVPLAVLDIPLLYETGRAQSCDAVVVVWAPEFLCRARVLARPGMDEKRLAAIRARQLPAARKRARADFAVPSGLGRGATWRGLARVARLLREPCPAESGAAD